MDRSRAAPAARVAWTVAAISLTLTAAGVVLLVLNRSTLQANSGEPLWVTVMHNVAAPFAAVVGTAILGAVVVARVPRNRMAWLLLATSLLLGTAIFGQEYAVRGLRTAGATLPAARELAWTQVWISAFAFPLVIVLVLLLFPDGRLPSRAWRPVVWIGVVAAIARVLSTMNNPFSVGLGVRTRSFALPVTMPPRLWSVGRFVDTWAHGVVTLGPPIALAAAGGALFLRFRRARGEERLQLKALAYAGSLIAVGFVVEQLPGFPVLSRHYHPILDHVSTYGGLVWTLMAAIGFPVLIGLAILNYRLYDLDLVINKTVVFGGLAVFITAVYVTVVVGLGAAMGSAGRFDPGLSILATAIVAVAFQPARERMQRLANRVVYGTRATPYEALSGFAEGIASAYATEDVLPVMARMAGEGAGVAHAEVWLRVGAELHRAAAWPDGARSTEGISLGGDEVPPIPGADRVYPVRHRGELLGVLTVTRAAGDRVAPAEDSLLRHLASQAGPVLGNVRLVGELQASRQRIVTAQDQERRRVERDLHDGTQQRLLALGMALGVARGRAGKGTDRELHATIDQAQVELKAALAELRDFAHGIHPEILTQAGLGPALISLAERSGFPVEIRPVPAARFPAPVESTVYFVVSEALSNVAKYAHASKAVVTVTHENGTLRVEVSDDGVGGATSDAGSGLLGLEDRVAAIGGRLVVTSPPGRGTRVAAEVPCE